MSRRRLIATALGLACLAAGAVLLAATLPDPATDTQDRLFGLWRFRHVAAACVLGLIGLGALARSINREAALAYATVLLSVLLFGGALEAVGRVGLVDWAALFQPARPATDGPGWTQQPHRDIRGETRQDIATRLGLPSDPMPFEFRTDAFGFRNDSDAPAEVILLGDSIVLGAAVPAADTVARQLARRLDRRVMQAALLGLSVQGEHDMLRAAGVPLAGKTVIQVVFEGNDLLDSRAYRIPPTEPPSRNGRASLVRLGWNALVARSRNATAGYLCDIAGQSHAFLWTRRSFAGVEAEVAPILAALDDFAAELSAEGATFAVVVAPTKYRVLHALCEFPQDSPLADTTANLTPLPAALVGWSRTSGVPLLDLTEPLAASARAGAIPWYWGDTHWNATGHAVAAEVIGNWIVAAPIPLASPPARP